MKLLNTLILYWQTHRLIVIGTAICSLLFCVFILTHIKLTAVALLEFEMLPLSMMGTAIRNDPEAIAVAFEHYPYSFRSSDMGEGFHDNKQKMLALVQHNSDTYQFASKRLLDDDQLFRVTVESAARAYKEDSNYQECPLQWASQRIRNDSESVLFSMPVCKFDLEYVGSKIKQNEEVAKQITAFINASKNNHYEIILGTCGVYKHFDDSQLDEKTRQQCQAVYALQASSRAETKERLGTVECTPKMTKIGASWMQTGVDCRTVH